MSRLTSRIARLERALGTRRAQKCPLCFSGGVGRTRINGERELLADDPIFDETWHCRRCGAEAFEIHFVTPLLKTQITCSADTGDLS
jgi:hypothetical protein